MERALLLTAFYRSGAADGESVPVARAMAFRYLLEHKKLYVGRGELIVGERGPAPKATPTFPEICTHTLGDFDILDSREKIPFRVDAEARRAQAEEIIPYWSKRSIRERIFESMEDDWIAAYESGLFTEFQEQRAPGHTVLDDKIYRLGFKDLIKKIRKSAQQLDKKSDAGASARRDELRAMEIAAEALIAYAGRYAEFLRELAGSEEGEFRRELEETAVVCDRVPARPPRTFREALQYYWFVHLGVITELNTWDSFNPGRLDRHLWPFYRDGLADGSLTKQGARELLEAFWVKFNNQPAPPKVGVTAQESNTYTDFCLINLGGVDEEGEDAVNELTFLILDVIEEMRLLQPGSMIQVSRKNPDRYLHRALRIVRTGFGQPSVFNTEAIVGELLRQGKSLVDARNGGASGCVETGAFGKESYILTGYLNLPKILEIALHDGIDPRRKTRVGPSTGTPASFASFDDLYTAFERQLRHVVDVKIRGNRVIERLWAAYLPAPFMSLLIDDCIERGRDYNDGGPRYNTSY
ncbi:MAG TPA: formate C-acetyltransferase/glycerol dehydratase family glycyl radical enzyme, partial [Candidatus Eisenbacteria bacterium]|nr:formate C-acetyltransferase/glycerol dehydratase family glycyl radical enzyme [Candidatus Eisenbacteria bacterium]